MLVIHSANSVLTRLFEVATVFSISCMSKVVFATFVIDPAESFRKRSMKGCVMGSSLDAKLVPACSAEHLTQFELMVASQQPCAIIHP